MMGNELLKQTPWQVLLTYSLMFTIPFCIALMLFDAFAWHDIARSDYKTPWFSPNWWTQPYFHLRFINKPSRVYWGKNYIGDRWWLIKEVTVGGKVFWTVLEEQKIHQGENG